MSAVAHTALGDIVSAGMGGKLCLWPRGSGGGGGGSRGGGGGVSPLSIPISEPGRNLRGEMRRQDSVGSGSAMSGGGNGGGSESKDGGGEVSPCFGQ